MEPTIRELISLLGRRSTEPDFPATLRSVLGDFETWTDEGDTFHTSRGGGVEVLANGADRVKAIFLFGPGSKEGQYRGELPLSLSFSDSREVVRSRLGMPDETGDGEVYLGDVVYPWDKYVRDGYSVHVRYGLDQEGIGRITLLAPERTS